MVDSSFRGWNTVWGCSNALFQLEGDQEVEGNMDYGTESQGLDGEMSSQSLYLPTERYLGALKRLRQRIVEGAPLVFVDSTEVGSKYTHCSWGLCSGDKEAWPDVEDHLFPEQYREHGRIAPLYRRHGQVCPLDRNLFGDPSGCFFRCRVFLPSELVMTEDLALRLFDKAIVRAKKLEGDDV